MKLLPLPLLPLPLPLLALLRILAINFIHAAG